MRVLEDERMLLHARYEQSRRPSGEQKYAIGSVVFLAIVGIVFPLLLMPAEPTDTRSSVWTSVTTGLFILGIAMFLALLVFQLVSGKSEG